MTTCGYCLLLAFCLEWRCVLFCLKCWKSVVSSYRMFPLLDARTGVKISPLGFPNLLDFLNGLLKLKLAREIKCTYKLVFLVDMAAQSGIYFLLFLSFIYFSLSLIMRPELVTFRKFLRLPFQIWVKYTSVLRSIT